MKKSLIFYESGNVDNLLFLKEENGDIKIFEKKYIKNNTYKCNGRFKFIKSFLHAIFSHQNKNSLYLKDTLIEITPDITFEGRCEQSETETSWFKILDKGKCIYEIEYKNGKEPFIDDMGFDDWNIVNFGGKLKEYFEELKKNPHQILFLAGKENNLISDTVLRE